MTRTAGGDAEEVAGVVWGADSEYGRLRDVLLGPPDNFRWLPTSAISKATLESGGVFDPELARVQHRELVDAYHRRGSPSTCSTPTRPFPTRSSPATRA